MMSFSPLLTYYLVPICIFCKLLSLVVFVYCVSYWVHDTDIWFFEKSKSHSYKS